VTTSSSPGRARPGRAGGAEGRAVPTVLSGLGRAVLWAVRRLWLLASLLFVWWGVTRAGWIEAYRLPSPGAVLGELRHGFTDERIDLAGAVTSTFLRLLQGWAIGVFAAVLLGITTAAKPFLEDGVRPLMSGLQAVPTIAFLPLAILWFGFGPEAVLAITIFGTFKPMVLATYAAVHQVSPTLRQAGRAMGARGVFYQRTLILPATVPALVTGLRLSWAFAWRSLMAAELIVGGTPGLGQVLEEGRELNDIELVVGVIVLIAAIGVVIEQVGFTRFERWVRRRWGLATPV
jgi:NitT/TauT family transport system permease protein